MAIATTSLGRAKILHPNYNQGPEGTSLHTTVSTCWTNVSDHLSSRFFTYNALGNGSFIDFDHNFKASFTDLRFVLYKRNTGNGELTRLTALTSPALSSFTIAATTGLETTQVRVTNNSGAAQDIALLVLQGDPVSGGGGGGGSGINWRQNPGDSPFKSIENGEEVYLYDAGLTAKMVVYLRVPASYVSGNQIKMKVGAYSPSTSNTILLETDTYLIRSGVDAIDSVTNKHDSGNSALTNTAPANRAVSFEMNLTDGSGQINSVAVSPGDFLRVELIRGTDTDTDSIRFMPNLTEVSFV